VVSSELKFKSVLYLRAPMSFFILFLLLSEILKDIFLTTPVKKLFIPAESVVIDVLWGESVN
jgi:hypothetical protein